MSASKSNPEITADQIDVLDNLEPKLDKDVRIISIVRSRPRSGVIEYQLMMVAG